MIVDKNNSAVCPAINELIALRHHASKINFFGNNKVHSNYVGNKLSIARGRGMDFDEVRHYQAGDDVRLIHWSLTARLGTPYTKVYREERERMVYLVVDQSSSMSFGTKVAFKNVLAAKIAATLGWAALANHEQVGGIIFSDESLELIKPKRSRQQLLRMFNLFHNGELRTRQAGGLLNALQLLNQNLQTGSIVIIISDFLNLDAVTSQYLKLINRRAEIINILTYDPLEVSLPEHGFYSFTDSGKNKLSISATNKNKQKYAATFNERLDKIQQLANENRMQLVSIATNDYIVNKINHGVMKYGY